MEIKAVKNKNFIEKDTLVFFITKENQKEAFQLKYLKEIKEEYISFKKNKIFFFPNKKGASIITCGLGEEKLSLESIRIAGATVTKFCNKNKIKSINIILSKLKDLDETVVIKSIAEGLLLANYKFSNYLSEDDSTTLLKKINFISEIKDVDEILEETKILSENTFYCRDMVNETSEKSNADYFVKEARKLAKASNVSLKVLTKETLKKKKFGLLLAVNQGSKIPARLLVIEYKGNAKNKKSIALVGKGITFDSGGINLKPSGHIETMRMDMAGAATVFSTIKAASELKIKKNIFAVIPLTENMLSNDSYRPGDIFKSYNGKTVEIGNTDAEGRLILADAISFTEKEIKPEYIIDLATLTGACIVSFGETIAAYLSTDENMIKNLEKASNETGDKLWRLPLDEDYEDRLKSDIADLNNISSEKNAGTITAAIFLKKFIDKTKWAHIDIAGTAWYSKERGYRPKRATGFGVRLLVNFISNLKI